MKKRLILLINLLIPVSFCFSQAVDSLKRFESSHGQMGTIFKVICYAPEKMNVDSIINNAFRLIDSLNLVLSDYLPDNELKKLCENSGTGRYIKVSDVLFEVTEKSLYWSKFTKGAFDISIGPYTQLWRRARRQDTLPDKARLENASRSVGFRHIRIKPSERQLLLKRKGMQLDFGGIGQGYAADRVYELLEASGIPMSLVDGGGDIYAGEAPPGQPGWKIAVEDLDNSEKYLYLTKQSISTSGDLYQFLEIDGIKYSHIIDPKTGLGITTPRTVTIIAPDAVTADVLATAISITGPEKGFKLIRKLRNVKVRVLQSVNGKISQYETGDFNFIK